MRTLVKIVLVVFASVGVHGCGQLGDILALRRGLVHEFGTDAISVNVDTRAVLTVLFTNADTATLVGPDPVAFGRRVAEYVRDHYRGYRSLDRVKVGFGQSRRTGGVTMSSTRVIYSFTTAQLGAPRDTTQGAGRRET